MFLTATATYVHVWTFAGAISSPTLFDGGKLAETKPCKDDRFLTGVRVVPPQGRGGQGHPPGACIGDISGAGSLSAHRWPRMAQRGSL